MIKKVVFGLTLLVAMWVFVYPRVEYLFGPLGVWGAISGKNLAEGDLAPVEFARLVRRSTPNDSLVCGAGFCPAATPDLVAPVFGTGAAELRQRLDAILRATVGSEAIDRAPEAGRLRYLVRTKWMRFPDVIDADVFDVGPGQSTLALYSRSTVGTGDQGVNKARLLAIMDQLQVATPADAPAPSN